MSRRGSFAVALLLVPLFWVACASSVSSAEADPLPVCADFDRWQTNDAALSAGCQVGSADGSGRSLHAHFPPDHAGKVVVEVFGRAGEKIQTVEESAQFAVYGAPSWQDLDKDGSEELMVLLQTSANNARWAVWRGRPAGGALHRAGELFGVQVEPFAQRQGLIYSRIHGSCCDGVYQLHRFDGQDKLALVAEADWSEQRQGDFACVPKQELDGLSVDEARKLLCARTG